MVDPNPARGMPVALARYWLIGKGAAKIRWRMPHDFDRCVRQLRKYFPKNPEGLCNILHQKAVGAPPGKGHPGTHSIVAAMAYPFIHVTSDRDEINAAALLASQSQLGEKLWAGPIAPIGRPTGEPRRTRIFEPGALKHRMLPLPLDWRKVVADGHQGGVTVGRMLGITYGPDHTGQDYVWAWGDWLSEEMVPESKVAQYMVNQGVVGASVDPGGRVSGTMDPETGFDHVTQYTIGGVTLVPIPAFTSMRIYNLSPEGDWPDDDPDMAAPSMANMDEPDCGCDSSAASADMGLETYSVNSSGWRGLPLAPRDAVFDNDDAVKRIAAWANVNASGADVSKLHRSFLWRDPQQPETAPTSYRLPVGDIINGRLTLIYHAIYAAAALISGAHGGLPGISDEDKNQLRNVISEIYPIMAREFNDPSIKAPWDRPETEGAKFAMEEFVFADMNPKEPYGDVTYADPGYQEDGKKRYPLDSEEHCRAAWSYINMPKNAEKYTPEQLKAIKGRIKAALKRYGVAVNNEGSAFSTLADDSYPLEPPRSWFEDPKLAGKTRLTVDPDGRVYGHLAAWGECHRDVTNRECVLAPKSKMEYRPFHLGFVATAEGDMLHVGKIVMDTRHADIQKGFLAASLHYDDTGDEVAVVRAGEDRFGIWVAGAVVPEADVRKVAKLRRSPLSGDWRRVNGNLELTAALAVNVPAFPVYAMENEEQLALTAAGTVMESFDGVEDEVTVTDDSDDLAGNGDEYVEEQDDRAWRLRELIEDDDILVQRDRAVRMAILFAADTEEQPVAGVDDAQIAAEAVERQGMAHFTVVSEPMGANAPTAAG